MKVTGNDITKGKPDPQVFLMAARDMKIEPAECMVFEDALLGVEAAKRAGMYVIARKAQHNSDLDFSEADHVVSDLREIPHLLRKRK